MTEIEKSVLLKEELDNLRPFRKDLEEKVMQKLRLDWNYHSNNLEGNTLTYGETKALILFGITAQGKPLKDHFEITGHDEAIKWIIDILDQERPITENFIRELHKLILKESYEVDAMTPEGLPTKKQIRVGEYKTTPNHVKTKTGEIFRFATPEETPAKMNDLIVWYNEKKSQPNTNPIILAAEFHYRYIRIHPFDDGNGRTARILMNFILMQYGYPPVIIKTEDKENYFAALRLADAGQLTNFIAYISLNLNRSLELMISGAKGENIDDEDDLNKEIALLEQRLKTVGKPIEVQKSGRALIIFIKESYFNLEKIFQEKCSIFEKFYFKKNHYNYINSFEFNTEDDNSNNQLLEMISEKTNNMKLSCYYQGFNYENFPEFNYSSEISISFNKGNYQIKNSNKLLIKKTYNQQLSKQEINQLVNSEMQAHKKFIEQKIQEAENKKL